MVFLSFKPFLATFTHSPNSFLPSISENSKDVDFSYDEKRKSVFEGIKFLLFDSKQMKTLSEILMEGGGTCELSKTEDLLEEKEFEGNVVIVTPRSANKSLAKILSEKEKQGYHLTNEEQIGFAVLYCDAKRFCIPYIEGVKKKEQNTKKSPKGKLPETISPKSKKLGKIKLVEEVQKELGKYPEKQIASIQKKENFKKTPEKASTKKRIKEEKSPEYNESPASKKRKKEEIVKKEEPVKAVNRPIVKLEEKIEDIEDADTFTAPLNTSRKKRKAQSVKEFTKNNNNTSSRSANNSFQEEDKKKEFSKEMKVASVRKHDKNVKNFKKFRKRQPLLKSVAVISPEQMFIHTDNTEQKQAWLEEAEKDLVEHENDEKKTHNLLASTLKMTKR